MWAVKPMKEFLQPVDDQMSVVRATLLADFSDSFIFSITSEASLAQSLVTLVLLGSFKLGSISVMKLWKSSFSVMEETGPPEDEIQ